MLKNCDNQVNLDQFRQRKYNATNNHNIDQIKNKAQDPLWNQARSQKFY